MRDRIQATIEQLSYYRRKAKMRQDEAVAAKDELARAKMFHLAEIKTLRAENERNTSALIEAANGEPVRTAGGSPVCVEVPSAHASRPARVV